MSKEIKDINAPSRWNMRIWDDDNKEWLCQSDGDNLTYYGFDITGGEVTEFQGLPKWHPDRHLIWEQSTGLKDKNGKEIYDGDIVKVCDKHVSSVHQHPCGEWVLPQFLHKEDKPMPSLLWHCDKEQVEVIGNIHENPELLGDEE